MVALGLSRKDDIAFDEDFEPFRGLYNNIVNGDFLTTSPSTWRATEIANFRTAATSDWGLIEQYSAQAEQQGKRFVVMVNPGILASPAISGWAGHQMDLSEDKKRSLIRQFQIDSASSATKGVWNHTIFSDDYLCSWQMIFVFEHPLDSVTHTYRLIEQDFIETRIGPDKIEPVLDLSTSLDHSRALLRFCLGKSQRTPASQPLLIHKDAQMGGRV